MRKLLLTSLIGIAVDNRAACSSGGDSHCCWRPPISIHEHRAVRFIRLARATYGLEAITVMKANAYVWTSGHWEVPPREHAVKGCFPRYEAAGIDERICVHRRSVAIGSGN